MKNVVYKYTFQDGTELKLLNIGFSVQEVWKLQEIHGKCLDVTIGDK